MKVISLLSSFCGGYVTGYVTSLYIFTNHKQLHPLEYTYKKNNDTLISDMTK